MHGVCRPVSDPIPMHTQLFCSHDPSRSTHVTRDQTRGLTKYAHTLRLCHPSSDKIQTRQPTPLPWLSAPPRGNPCGWERRQEFLGSARDLAGRRRATGIWAAGAGRGLPRAHTAQSRALAFHLLPSCSRGRSACEPLPAGHSGPSCLPEPSVSTGNSRGLWHKGTQSDAEGRETSRGHHRGRRDGRCATFPFSEGAKELL